MKIVQSTYDERDCTHNPSTQGQTGGVEFQVSLVYTEEFTSQLGLG